MQKTKYKSVEQRKEEEHSMQTRYSLKTTWEQNNEEFEEQKLSARLWFKQSVIKKREAFLGTQSENTS